MPSPHPKQLTRLLNAADLLFLFHGQRLDAWRRGRWRFDLVALGNRRWRSNRSGMPTGGSAARERRAGEQETGDDKAPTMGRAAEEPVCDHSHDGQLSPIFSAWMKAACGISTLPNWRMRFLPSFCFSRSLRLRVTSPP